MSKAEEEANKRYSITRGDDTQETSGIDMQRALDFIEGYHQAEKDLELTWEDIQNIRNIIAEMMVESYTRNSSWATHEEFSKEVLKRFKAQKGE